jgi:hypothetical protein
VTYGAKYLSLSLPFTCESYYRAKSTSRDQQKMSRCQHWVKNSLHEEMSKISYRNRQWYLHGTQTESRAGNDKPFSILRTHIGAFDKLQAMDYHKPHTLLFTSHQLWEFGACLQCRCHLPSLESHWTSCNYIHNIELTLTLQMLPDADRKDCIQDGPHQH